MARRLIRLVVDKSYISVDDFDSYDKPGNIDDYSSYKAQVGDVCLGNKLTLSERNELVYKHRQAKFLYHSMDDSESSFMEIICTPYEAVKYMTMNKRNLINTALELFDFALLEPTIEPSAIKPQFADPNDNGVRYLQEIIKRCPSVRVEKPEVVKPKVLTKSIKDYLKAKADVPLSKLITLLLSYSKVYKFLELAVDCGKAEDFQYPDTFEQYAALSLMQTYGTPFRSCQYLPIHEFTIEEIMEYVSRTVSDTTYRKLTRAATNFELLQCEDFYSGLCDRFFVLNKSGFVEKRFSIHYNRSNEVLLSNFYNNTPVNSITIGGAVVSNNLMEDIFSFEVEGESYCNKDYHTVHGLLHKIDNIISSSFSW